MVILFLFIILTKNTPLNQSLLGEKCCPHIKATAFHWQAKNWKRAHKHGNIWYQCWGTFWKKIPQLIPHFKIKSTLSLNFSFEKQHGASIKITNSLILLLFIGANRREFLPFLQWNACKRAQSASCHIPQLESSFPFSWEEQTRNILIHTHWKITQVHHFTRFPFGYRIPRAKFTPHN